MGKQKLGMNNLVNKLQGGDKGKHHSSPTKTGNFQATGKNKTDEGSSWQTPLKYGKIMIKQTTQMESSNSFQVLHRNNTHVECSKRATMPNVGG